MFNRDQISDEFKQQVLERHAQRPLSWSSNRFSSGEVAGMSPSEHAYILDQAAAVQRGHPENAMNRLQRTAGSGVYGHMAEHIGDISHRLNESGGRFGTEFVEPKVRRALTTLTHPYGFEREHMEQMRSNRTDMEALTAVGKEYSEAHAAVPVYNQPTQHASNAAWRLGQMDFSGTAMSMKGLNRLITDREAFRHSMSQQGTVEFLRNQEERGY
jgi:hypothetical protein